MEFSDKESTTKADQSKKKRSKLSKIQLDTDFSHKPSIRAIKFRFGNDGVIAFINLLCAMGGATNAEIERDGALAIAADELGRDKAEEFIVYCLEYEFISLGSKNFLLTNTRIITDQESVAEKQESWRASKRQPKESGRSPIGFHEDSNRNPIGIQQEQTRIPRGSVKTEDLNTEDLNTEDLKKLPSTDQATQDALKRWAAHRHKLKLPFDQMALEATAMQWAGRSADFVAAVNYSISNSYRTIVHAPKEREDRARNGPSPPELGRRVIPNADKTKAMLDEIFSSAEKMKAKNDTRKNPSPNA